MFDVCQVSILAICPQLTSLIAEFMHNIGVTDSGVAQKWTFWCFSCIIAMVHRNSTDCGNLEGTDWMEDLRCTNTDPSVHFRKANTDLSMHLRKANTEFLLPV